MMQVVKHNEDVIKTTLPYNLEDSLATQLVERGVDSRYIQELLGNTSTKTPEIYNHFSTKNLSQIRSLFDSLELDRCIIIKIESAITFICCQSEDMCNTSSILLNGDIYSEVMWRGRSYVKGIEPVHCKRKTYLKKFFLTP